MFTIRKRNTKENTMLNRIFDVLLGNATLGFFTLTKDQIVLYSLLIAVVLILCAVIVAMLIRRSKSETDEAPIEQQPLEVIDDTA